MQFFCTISRLGPGLNAAVSFGSLYEIGVAPTPARPEPQILTINPARPVSATAADRIMVSSSSRLDADSFDYVAQIARSVPERLYRLHLAAVAGRAHLQIVFTDCQPDWHLPFAAGIFSQISAEFGRCPGISSIYGDGNSLDARATVERNTFKRALCASLQRCPIRDISDEGPYLKAVDRNGGFRCCSGLHAVTVVVRDPVRGLHPKSVEDIVDHRDFAEVLNPIGAVVAWHNETQRIAVEDGKIRSVHRISEHDLTVTRMIDIERLDEIGSFIGHGPVQTIEC